jgi:hypothetical protein
MNALDLIMLGRQLTKIGEEVLRDPADSAGKDAGGHGEQPAGKDAGGHGEQPAPFMPTGPSLVLRDVFAHPGSSITDITARTGLPQSYVSESVARLRGQGILETSADPVSAQHPRTVAAKGSASVDGALAAALGEPEDGPGVAEIITALAALAERLRPGSPGPIRRQLDRAVREP